MARLKIRVNEKNGKTVSKFAATKIDKVIFHNDGSKALTVSIQDATSANSPLCDVDDNPVPSFVMPRNSSETFWVCGEWNEFKYTAQIKGTQAEDPIVIIERKSSSSVGIEPIVIIEKKGLVGAELLLGLAGLGIGIAAGVFVARGLRTRGPQAGR